MAETDDRAETQAKAQMDSIAGMVERLQHARECTEGNGHDLDFLEDAQSCDIEPGPMLDNSGWYYTGSNPPTEQQWDDYHNPDKAEEYIHEDALSVEVRDDEWKAPGQAEYSPSQFQILLCTGGPAVRIMGELDQNQEPCRAWLEYQDWGTPWTQYFQAEGSTLLTYAQQFYFGS